MMRVCVWGDKEEEEYIISIDAYCIVSEQGNLSNSIWHVRRNRNMCDEYIVMLLRVHIHEYLKGMRGN